MGVVISPRVVHTAQLVTTELAAMRGLVDLAFGGRFGDADWNHALGGLHVFATDEDQVIAHGAVVQRQLVHNDRPIRTGYVEAVAVHPERQRRGFGSLVMEEIERIIRAAYDLGALSASAGAARFYQARGWVAWRGPTGVVTPAGLTRTPDEDDSTFVLPVPSGRLVDVTGMLACDWREGDVW